MISNLYVVYDRAAKEYGPIFHSKSDATALRDFLRAQKEVMYSADFTLCRIGTYENEKCIVDVQNPEPVDIVREEAANESGI